MTTKKRPTAIALVNTPELLEKTQALLISGGWKVICKQVSAEALALLEKLPKYAVPLFISDFKLPKMEGDDILQKVQAISPLTQRMIMVPTDKPDILISAINKANINACITLPFEDDEFIALTRNCYRQHRLMLKKEQLRRVTEHQNRQMYTIAKKLKKKDDAYKALISEKEAARLKLKSEKRKLQGDLKQTQAHALSDYLTGKEIQTTPDCYENEFFSLCFLIKHQLLSLASKVEINPDDLDCRTALENRIPVLEENAAEQKQEEPGTETETLVQPGEDQPPPNPAAADFPPQALVRQVLTRTYGLALKTESDPAECLPGDMVTLMPGDPETNPCGEDVHPLDCRYEITLLEDDVKASIKRIPSSEDRSDPPPSGADILDLLRHKGIIYGVLDDDAIDTWLTKSGVDQIVIAEGSAARPGRNGRVTFHFETEFTNPGKINQDGTIDFRDRGETPFVKSEDLMAEKDPAVEGRPGTSVYGETIEVPEVEDPPFEAGAGTTLSEDGLTIHAALDGQPHLDKLGTISVNPELVIPGDVDFETGNIDFQGNIVVKGIIKEGFQVKGIHVTAKEIEGGIIDISGDLNVSAGITDATISAQGNVYAKFVNHSNINAYGDLCVQKEIIDSTILLSGRCVNASGHIIASAITAKLGIETGAVGTPSAGVSTFKVGVDEHIEKLIETVNQQLETSIEKTKMIKADIKAKEDEDHALYEHISERAQIQDRAQVDMKEMLKELKALKDAGDTAQIPQVTDEIKKMKETAATAEKELNSIFETQDRIADEISRMKNSLAAVEEENKKHVQKRKALRTFAKKDAPAAEVLVSKTAVQGTIIKGPHSSIILPEDRSNIKIHETRDPESPANLYMMAVSDG